MNRYGQWIVAVFVGMLALTALEGEVHAQEDGAATADAPSVAGTSIGGFFGYDLDFEEPLLGADARVGFDIPDVAPGFGLAVNPALSFYLVSGGTFLQVDANVLAQFALDNGIIPYGGLGLAITHTSDDFDSNTEVQFNLLVAGATIPIEDAISAFAQMRLTRHSFSDMGFSISVTALTLMGGVSFGI